MGHAIDYREWLRLPQALSGALDGDPVSVLDLCDEATMLEHSGSISPGQRKRLSFSWEDANYDLLIECESELDQWWEADAGSFLARSIFAFVESPQPLLVAIGQFRARVAAAQMANFEGRIEENRVGGDTTIADLGGGVREHVQHYVRCRLINGVWMLEGTTDPIQPADGFTVGSFETPEQIQLLRLAYEESDAEGRQLLREFAAMSIGG